MNLFDTIIAADGFGLIIGALAGVIIGVTVTLIEQRTINIARAYGFEEDNA